MSIFNEIQRETPAEKAKRIGVPLIPALPIKTEPKTFNPVIAVCGHCGIELHGVMGYSCQNIDCPTGLGPIGVM